MRAVAVQKEVCYADFLEEENEEKQPFGPESWIALARMGLGMALLFGPLCQHVPYSKDKPTILAPFGKDCVEYRHGRTDVDKKVRSRRLLQDMPAAKVEGKCCVDDGCCREVAPFYQIRPDNAQVDFVQKVIHDAGKHWPHPLSPCCTF